LSTRNLQQANIEELIQTYAQAAAAHGQALAAGNPRSANRAHDKLASAYRELRNRAMAHLLLPLLGSEDENVRLWAAAHALEFSPEQGEPVLLKLATAPKLLGMQAKYTLKAWREGTLKFP